MAERLYWIVQDKVAKVERLVRQDGAYGEHAEGTLLPWAKTGKPSGRFVIEFEELEGAQAALEMHKKKMGPRDIGVFRINVGDSEETMTVPRAMVAAMSMQELDKGACSVNETWHEPV